MATLRQQIGPCSDGHRFRDLLRKVRSYRESEDLSLIKKATNFPCNITKHGARVGRAYWRILAVATILAEMRLDTTASPPLLHDVVEDTSVTVEDITTEFGEQVAHIVEGVTKINKIEFASSEEAQRRTSARWSGMMDDIRVVLIKLADRLHNMRTLQFLSTERSRNRARDARYLRPHCHRLGMGKIRGELEDLAFQYVDPSLQPGQGRHRVAPQGSEAFLSEVQASLSRS